MKYQVGMLVNINLFSVEFNPFKIHTYVTHRDKNRIDLHYIGIERLKLSRNLCNVKSKLQKAA